MSFIAFKEVSISNPGSETRYGSDDLLDIMKILNGKVATGRRPNISNPWRFSGPIELKQTELDPPAPTEADVILLYNDPADNKAKIKKQGGTVISIEELGTGVWDKDAPEAVTNKTIPIESNFIKHGTTNFVGDLLKWDGTRYNRIAKGAANQVLAVNPSGTDLEWVDQTGGGGGGEGEANTASNVGTAGIGVFHQKLSLDLQFKKLFSPTGSVIITDNTGQERIDLEIGASVVKTTQQNIYGNFTQLFPTDRLQVANPDNTFSYWFRSSAITGNRAIILPLLTAQDTIAVLAHAQTLLNKTLESSIINTDLNTIKHSTTNLVGELLRNTGSKFERFAKGPAGTFLRVNDSGTDLEWDVPEVAGGGVRLPDNTIASTTGRWGAFWGGAGNGFNMLGFAAIYNRLHGSSLSSAESITEIYTPASISSIAEFKTAAAFRRDSSCVFKLKWKLMQTTACKVKIGLSDATALPAAGAGSQTTRYDVGQSGTGHLEFDGGINRYGVRCDSGASALGEPVTEVLVRFRKYGSPSGQATVGIRKASDGTLVSLGQFTPGSFGSGEQTALISAPSNVYAMQLNDLVTVEFPSNDNDGLELDENDGSSPSGYTSREWTSSWSNIPGGSVIAIRFKTTSGGGTSGDTPLANANGIMVHGTIGTHSSYQIARNNGGSTQTTANSGKSLANTSVHTLEININSSDIKVIIDGTQFTYTTFIPSTSIPMALFLHIESAAASEKGLGIVHGQVVMS